MSSNQKLFLKLFASFEQIEAFSDARALCTVRQGFSDGSEPSEVWCANKNGTVSIRDARCGRILHVITTKNAYVKEIVEVESLNEVWIAFSDGLVRVFSSCDPYHYRGAIGISTGVVGAAFCIAPCADFCYVGNADGNISRYGLQSKQLLQQIAAHKGAVKTISVHPETHIVVSGGDDGVLALWRGEESIDLLAKYQFHSAIRCVTVVGDGTIWCGSETGELGAIDVWARTLVKIVRENFLNSPILSIVNHCALLFIVHYSGEVECLEITTRTVLPQKLILSEQPGRCTLSSTNAAIRYRILLHSRGCVSTLTQDAFNLVDAAVQTALFQDKTGENVSKLVQLLGDQKKRLSLRREPPLNLELLQAVKGSTSWLDGQTHSLQCHVEFVEHFHLLATFRLTFERWRLFCLSKYSKRVINKMHLLLHQSNTWHQAESLHRWTRFHHQRQIVKKKQDCASQLQRCNEKQIIGRFFFAFWEYAARRRASKQIEAFCRTSSVVTLRDYLIKWAKWALQGRPLRKKKSIADCCRRVTENGMRQVYYNKWSKFLAFQRKQHTIAVFLSSIRSSGSSFYLVYSFRRWMICSRKKAEKRRKQRAYDLVFGDNLAFLRLRSYQKWRGFVRARHTKQTLNLACQVVKQLSTRQILGTFFFAWMQHVRFKHLSSPVAVATTQIFARQGATGLIRIYFHKWLGYLQCRRSISIQEKAVTALMRQTIFGFRLVHFQKWIKWLTVSRHRKKLLLRQELLTRNFQCGLRMIYYGKWCRHIQKHRQMIQRTHLAAKMGNFSTLVIRSRAFQFWLQKVVVKRRIRFLVACNHFSDGGLVFSVWSKWQRFAIRKACARHVRNSQLLKHKEQLLIDGQELLSVEYRKTAELTEVSQSSTTLYQRCNGELSDVLLNVETVERKLKQMTLEHEQQLLKLGKEEGKVRALRRVSLSAHERKSPAVISSEWMAQWIAIDKQLHILCKKAAGKHMGKELYNELQNIITSIQQAKKKCLCDWNEQLIIHAVSVDPKTLVGGELFPALTIQHRAFSSTSSGARD